VLASASLLLFVLGQSLNIMTLGGMAAAVGLIIDDTIVVVEHVVGRLRGESASTGVSTHRARVLAAAGEFSLPLLGASLATVVIHLPPVFLTGVTGEFFKALSLTMALSLIISFLVAWLAIPILSARLLGAKDAAREDAGPIFRAAQFVLAAGLRLVLRLRWIVPLACAAWLALGWQAFNRLPSGFMPAMDEGGFVLDYLSAPGTSLAETDRLVREVESILRETPEVVTYSRRTGAQLGGGLTEANEGDFFVRLAPHPRRDIEDVMADVRAAVERRIPGLQIELLQLMEDLIGDLTAVPQPIEVKLSALDPTMLEAEAIRIADVLSKMPGIVDVNNGLSIAGDALEVRIDPERASMLGLDASDVAGQVRTLLAGTIAGTIVNQPRVISVRLWSHEDDRSIEDDVGRFRLVAPNGTTSRLSDVATISRRAGQPTISRENLRQTVSVTARTEGTDLGSAIRTVRGALDVPGALSPGISYRLGGLYGEQQRAFRSLLWVFAAAITLLFILILFMYESIRVAAAVTFACLLTMPGVALGLLATGTELNISAMMGFAMIVGAAAEVAVFYCSEVFRHASGRRPSHEALVAAARSRLRPISMTSLAAILALTPLALGIGEGAAMLRPLAIAIIAGLIVQVPIVLGVLPAMLGILVSPRTSGRPRSTPDA
jgi:multidrug efflux pump subunit AcrB